MALFFPPGMPNPMTAGGDIIYGGANGGPTRLANGSNGQRLISAGGTSAPSWLYGVTTASKTANYSIAVNDDVIRATSAGGAFSLTLPDAASCSGKIYWIVLTGAGANAGVDLKTTSSQTVGGLASANIIFNTPNDYLGVASDGSNWQIISWGISVGCSYTGQPTGTINGSTDNIFPTKVSDPNTDYATGTGIYTTRYAGKYSIALSGFITITTGSFTTVQLLQNATVIAQNQLPFPSNFSNTISTMLSITDVPLAVSDTLKVRFNGNGSPVFSANTGGSWFTVVRIGW